MVFKILRKDSSDYRDKLKKLKDLQIALDTKRWAAITERQDHSQISSKLSCDSLDLDQVENISLAEKVKDSIKEDSSDLKIVQGNLKLKPALKLLEIQDTPINKIKVSGNGKSV